MKPSSTLLRAAAITVAATLVAGSALLVGGTASAAEVQVSGSEIAPNESTYVGWHEGYTPPGAPATVTDAGLTLTGKSQIINGLATPLTGQTFEEIAATTGLTVVAGGNKYSYQMPIFADPGTAFTTVRSQTDGWTLTGGIGGSTEGIKYTAAQIDGFLGTDFSVLAFGVQVQSGTTTFATVSFQGTTYRFNKVVVPDAKVTIVPSTISQADAANADKGFTVSGVEFAPNSPITISFRAPDGTAFGFSADGPIVTDEVGAFTLEHVYFTSSTGVLPAGIYAVVVTDGDNTSREANISVIDPTAPSPVTPAAPTPEALAATGLDDSPLFLTSGLGLLLAGIAAFGITVVARRRTAE
ncbi:hypothetical protein SAMN06296010_0497 [Agreia pratensis]|uniref:LPXTG-motif cell wall anchor domain-containing protein n=1 Tax=Agreia pratensis TaxID=150121 RepID=A0A1X7IGZ4_9MICO|nr:hypothetical protein SAMN06296010_0497 [Agreia pratensis]